MKKIFFKIIALGLFLGPMVASADTIEFGGERWVHSLDLDEATITNLDAVGIRVGNWAAGQADGFCFVINDSYNTMCRADGEIVFTSIVNNLLFDVDDWHTGDSVLISAYNGDIRVGSLSATSNGILDFSSFGAITRLYFDDSSSYDSRGVGYSTFVFDTVSSTVPEPATLALFGLGLAGIGFSRRKKA